MDAGYPLDRLQRALETAARSGDAPTRERASRKAEQWRAVLEGMARGGLTVGSRTPVEDAPAWVTLEVAHGGFATGRLLAEQPLDAQEQELLASLGPLPGQTDRERLNLWHLGDAGQDLLLAQLSAGTYRVELPEHAALPVVALLVDDGRAEEALDLVVALRPLLHRLRLTPVPTDDPQPGGTVVHLQPAGEVARVLARAEPPAQVRALRDALHVWTPLYDDLVDLWAATVDGDLPRRAGDVVEGGVPGTRPVPDWSARRSAWLERYALAVTTSHPGRHGRPRSTFARLHTALLTCPGSAAELAARDVPVVRRALADAVGRHGAPGDPTRSARQARQAADADGLQHAALAHVVAQRLARVPAEAGVPDLGGVLADVTPDELPSLGGPQPVPATVVRKASRALEAPVAELVARGVLPSAEVLADVLPQVVAPYLSAGLARPEAAALHARTYTAFRRRRSLLLVDLQHQVRLEELPWVQALRAGQAPGVDTSGPAREALREVVLLALAGFPQTPVPNPLLAELAALARQADLALPLVEEVASDIFTGAFTAKWRAAAVVASRQLEGTLYARYYDLPASWAPLEDQRPRFLDRWRSTPRPVPAPNFTRICTERAAEAGGRGRSWDVANNGAILEQSQVLTTHNLAVLVDGLDLQDAVRELAPELAERALDGVVRLHARLPKERHAQLLAVKSSAYALRQAVYLLSWCTPQEQARQAARLLERTEGTRLHPVAQGLAHVVDGGRFARDGRAARGAGRRLLGWTVGEHWLLDAPAS